MKSTVILWLDPFSVKLVLYFYDVVLPSKLRFDVIPCSSRRIEESISEL